MHGTSIADAMARNEGLPLRPVTCVSKVAQRPILATSSSSDSGRDDTLAIVTVSVQSGSARSRGHRRASPSSQSGVRWCSHGASIEDAALPTPCQHDERERSQPSRGDPSIRGGV